MAGYILSIDQGTTGSTVSVIDTAGRVHTKVNKPFRQIFPKPGWVEHDSKDIWSSILESMKEALGQSQINQKQIVAIGITNQRETVLGWDRKTGEPIGNAIVWQCRRTTEMCEKLKPHRRMIKSRTGLVTDPYFSGTKMAWFLKNNARAQTLAKKKQLCFGTVDTFLIWKLTGGQSFKTDHSNASRTLIYNLKKKDFDSDLMKLFKVKPEMLAEVIDSNGEFGKTSGVPGLPDGIPIRGVLGDQQAALFGQIGFKKGDAKITFGTGSFLLFNTGSNIVPSKKGLLTTVAWQIKGQKMNYALEGGAFICGAAVQWLRDGLQLFKESAEVEDLALQVESSEGVEFVPALTGLGAPHWRPEARGIITGLTRGSTKAHIARATLEAMALQNVDILLTMKKEAKTKLSKVRADGGATANNLLMQLQADYLGIPVELPENIETTSAGAALMAGLGVGVWSDLKQLEKVNPVAKEFKPKMKNKDRKLRLESWAKAVAKT